jgi:hypothetical protein
MRSESRKVDEASKALDDVVRLENPRKERKASTVLTSAESALE